MNGIMGIAVLSCICLGLAVWLLIIICVPKSESRIVQASKPVHLPKPKKYLDVTGMDEEDIANLEWQRDYFKGKSNEMD